MSAANISFPRPPNFDQQFFKKTLNAIVGVGTPTVSILMNQLECQGLFLQSGESSLESKIISFIKMGQQWLKQDDLKLIQQIAFQHIKKDESKKELQQLIDSSQAQIASQQEALKLLLEAQDIENLKGLLAQENLSDVEFMSNFASALQLIPKAQRPNSIITLSILFNPLSKKVLREEVLDALNSLAADDRAPFIQLAVDQLLDTESVSLRQSFLLFLARMYDKAKDGGTPLVELSQYCEKYSRISLPKVLELLSQAALLRKEAPSVAASAGVQPINPESKDALVTKKEIQALLDSLPQERQASLASFIVNQLEGMGDAQLLALCKKMILSIPRACLDEAVELFSKINTEPNKKPALIETILSSLHKYSDPELYHLRLSIIASLFTKGLNHEQIIQSVHMWESLSDEQQNKAAQSMGLLFDQSNLWPVLFFIAYIEPSKEVWSDYVDDLTAILFTTSPKHLFLWTDLFKGTSKQARAQILKDIQNFPTEGRDELINEIMQNLYRLEKEMVIPDANDRLNMLHMIIEGSF
jgi:hypothetical protein